MIKVFKNIVKSIIIEIMRKKFFLKELSNLLYENTVKYDYEYIEDIKKKFQSCGNGVVINGRFYISDPEFICCSDNVHIGDNAHFITRGGLTIGNNTHISRNVTIYTVSHNYSGNALPYDNMEIPEPVSIGENVSVGMNVSILPGVTIGDGAIIGMGTVVAEDVPELAIIVHSEHRIIKFRDKQHYRALSNTNKFSGLNKNGLTHKERNKFDKKSINKNSNTFFILNTGRCGGVTISKVLSQHPKIQCYHERRPQLIRLSTEYAYKTKSYEIVKKEFSNLYLNSCTSTKNLYGEVDQKLWNLVAIIEELFLEPKFIWLIRDGRNVVSSTYGRKWFSEEEKIKAHPTIGSWERWMFYRLDGHKCGEFTSSEWNQMSSFEKNCWHWFYINKEIETRIANVATDRIFILKLEEIEEKYESLLEFLEVEKINTKIPKLNTAFYDLKHWSSWNKEERLTFKKYCGNGMDNWYPGWKDVNDNW
jgi:acetyltransferase-like isoleucine patch superfamily enzyme